MSEELKPCPFCGSGAYIYTYTYVDDEGDRVRKYRGECKHCVSPGMQSYTDQQMAITAWNTRPIEDALRARVVALEAERDALQMLTNCQGPILHGWFIDLSGLKDGWRLTGEWGDDNCVMRPLHPPPEVGNIMGNTIVAPPEEKE